MTSHYDATRGKHSVYLKNHIIVTTTNVSACGELIIAFFSASDNLIIIFS